MRLLTGLGLALALYSSGASAEPKPLKLPKAPAFVLEADRSAPAGRAAQIEYASNLIETTVELGRVADPLQGYAYYSYYYPWYTPRSELPGILYALAHREAENRVEPVRLALQDFDIEAVALPSIKAGLAASKWFHAQPLEIQREPSSASRLDFADIAPTGQVAFIRAGSFFSPDFGQIEIVVDLAIAPNIKGKKRRKKLPYTYFQRLVSVVQLPGRTMDPSQNARIWSTDKGNRARSAVAAGLARMEKMIPYALDLSQADVLRMETKGGDVAQAAGRYGRIVERDQDGVGSIVIWSKGLIAVQQAR